MVPLRSILTISSLTILSRLGGFVRDILVATLLGAGGATDALSVAIKLPAFFRRLCAEGALNTSFVPVFTGILVNKGTDQARAFASQVFTLLTLFLLLLVVLVECFLPEITHFIFPGFDPTSERMSLTLTFSRVLFPFIFFISLTAFYGGILNSYERFFAAASSPFMGNLFIVSGVLLFYPNWTDTGLLFAVFIALSGVVQLVWVAIPAWRLGLRPVFVWPRFSSDVRKFFHLLGPAVLGSSVTQINLFVGVMLASLLPVGSIAYLNFSDRLNQLPLSVIGTAVGTALLPLLARQLRLGKVKEADATQNATIEFVLLITLPAAAGLMVLAEPFIRFTFEHGRFTPHDTYQTALSLKGYASGLPAYVLAKVLSARFFAVKDANPPLIAGVSSVVLDIVMSLILMRFFQHVGIAIATSLASWLNITLLVILQYRHGILPFARSFLSFFLRLVVATGMMTVCLWFGSDWIALGSMASLGLFLLVIMGVVLYFGLAFVFGILHYDRIKMLIRQNKESSSR